MEYPPQTGPVSWPHSEWHTLVELVKEDLSPSTRDDGFTSVQAVTFRQPEPLKVDKKGPPSALGLPPQAPPPPPKRASTSSFHLVRLSEYLSMVVIVKCEDDGKWHLRRTRGHSDEEIRVFLNEMALKLKVSILFGSVNDFRQQLVDSKKEDDERLVQAWKQWDDEANTQEFLRELKRSFHLRPQSPYMEKLRSRRGGKQSSRRRSKKRSVDYGESALAFFVGNDIQLE